MKKIALAALAATCITGSALAADMPIKAAPVPVVVNPWDLAFGSGIYSDYNFRGISQSNRGPAVNAYFEPRYNVNDMLQLYAGVGGWSIAYPNRARAEVDFYGGVRPTFGKLALDFGVWYYYYGGGQCFAPSAASFSGCSSVVSTVGLPINGNYIKSDLSFLELYAKGAYTINDYMTVGAAFYYDRNWLNFGFDAKYLSGNVKFTAPSAWLATGYGMYLSGEVGHYWLGTTDFFYAWSTPINGFARNTGNPLPDYTHWNVGLGMTYKVFTVDLRYFDTTLNQGQCNAITSDHTATFNPATLSQINQGGFASKWCGKQFVLSLKSDLVYGLNVK